MTLTDLEAIARAGEIDQPTVLALIEFVKAWDACQQAINHGESEKVPPAILAVHEARRRLP